MVGDINLEEDMNAPYLNNKVRIIKINVTETCFFRCKTCFSWKIKKDKSSLDIGVYKKFIESLKPISDKRTSVNFTGGEPLSNPMIYELISISSKNKLYTNLNTNGWLVNDESIRKLYKASLTDITFSLDGSNAELHDGIRGMKGSFSRVLNGAKKVKSYFNKNGKRINAGVICTISSLNISDVISTVMLVQKEKYLDFIILNAVSSPLFDIENKAADNWFEEGPHSSLWPKDAKEITSLYAELMFLKNKGYKIANDISRLKMQYLYFMHPLIRPENLKCTIYKDLHLNNSGFVSNCHVNQWFIGDINKDEPDGIWHSGKRKDFVKKIIDCKINCHELINCGEFI